MMRKGKQLKLAGMDIKVLDCTPCILRCKQSHVRCQKKKKIQMEILDMKTIIPEVKSILR